MGFLLIAPLMPDEFKFSDEEVVEMLAEAIQRTLEPRTSTTGEAIGAETMQELSNALNLYIDQEVNAIKEDIQKETGS